MLLFTLLSSPATAPLLLLMVLAAAHTASGHGRLIQPPGRSTAWRYGFPTPPNYNDHEIYCGGYGRQWGVNGGKCGPCGDPWDSPQPRDNEGGGKYGLGVITATYKEGAEVELGVELTANHNGYFEFRLCPHNSPKTPVSAQCLDKHLLQKVDGSGHKYYPSAGSRKFYMRYRLPAGMTCKQCVLQWRYECASNWGVCANGTGMMGCGPQEEFRACADITIVSDDGLADGTPSVPDKPVPGPNDEDYNEIDTDRLHESDAKPEESNYSGHIVALVLASILVPLLLLLVILYFYFSREKLRNFTKRHADFWKKNGSGENLATNVGSNDDTSNGIGGGKSVKDLHGGSKLDFPNPPFGVAPSAPPRRNRPRGTSVSPTRAAESPVSTYVV